MRHTVPEARLAANPFVALVRNSGSAGLPLAGFARNLRALVVANHSSVAFMAQRFRDRVPGPFFEWSREGELVALKELQPFVAHCVGEEPPEIDHPGALDPLAQGYPGVLSSIALNGTPWDYPVSFLYLWRTSTGTYRELRSALMSTGRFTSEELAHFDYFGTVEDEYVAAAHEAISNASEKAIARSVATAEHVRCFEAQFWDRMAQISAI